MKRSLVFAMFILGLLPCLGCGPVGSSSPAYVPPEIQPLEFTDPYQSPLTVPDLQLPPDPAPVAAEPAALEPVPLAPAPLSIP